MNRCAKFYNVVYSCLSLQPPKFTPLHVKKKLRGPEQLSCFELYPISGCLLPGDWINVKLKFMPTEEVTLHVFIIRVYLCNYFYLD